MLTLIVIIAICVWAWNKYKKTPTVYPNFFRRNKWVKWNLIVQIAVSIFVALAGANMLSQGTSFLMGDWIGNIVGLLGFSDLSDLYGMAQESEMFDTSERMSTISEITSPLVMATMVSSICAFVGQWQKPVELLKTTRVKNIFRRIVLRDQRALSAWSVQCRDHSISCRILPRCVARS